MDTLISIPISLGRNRTLHIQQKPKHGGGGGGLFGALQSIASGVTGRSGSIHIQHVPADAPAVVAVCGDAGFSHDVQNDVTDKTQTIVVSTSSAEPVQICLRWPKDTGLARLHLQSSDYAIKSDMEMPATRRLTLGDGDFASARELVIASQSGAVGGLLPMEDVLDVSTSSGPVGITLLPLHPEKEGGASRENHKLSVKTSSGPLALNSKIDPAAARLHLPGRDCAVTLQTTSGSIRAVLGLTRSVRVASNSGSQHLTGVLTDLSRHQRSDFSSTTSSGSQNIAVVAASGLDTSGETAAVGSGIPEKAAAAAAAAETTGFVCKHAASSGSIRVAYPPAWEGTVEAHSGSGSVAVSGEGVETDRPARNRVTGVKGKGMHHTDVGTGSGSISVKFEA